MPDMLWIDIETSGLDPRSCKIGEVGMVLTDEYGNPKASRSWTVAEFTSKDCNPYVRAMHQKSGLFIASLQRGLPLDKVELRICEWINNIFENGKPGPMCGSSVQFDRSFLEVHMPAVAAMFSYRNIDVSTLKEICERVNPPVWEARPFANTPKEDLPHRSLPDLTGGTIPEYRFYLDNFLFALGDDDDESNF